MKWRLTEYGWMNLAQTMMVIALTIILVDGGWRSFFVAFLISGALTMAEFMGEHRARGRNINSFQKKT